MSLCCWQREFAVARLTASLFPASLQPVGFAGSAARPWLMLRYTCLHLQDGVSVIYDAYDEFETILPSSLYHGLPSNDRECTQKVFASSL